LQEVINISKQKQCEKWEDTKAALNHIADEFEKRGYYIERNLIDLPQTYSDTVISYMNQVAGTIELRNHVKALEEDLEKLKGTVFDLMNQLDEVESRLSKGVRTE